MRRLTGFFFLFFSVITLAQESLFTLLDNSETGIDFSNDLVDTKQHSIFLYANYYGGAGVGIGDFDNDGTIEMVGHQDKALDFKHGQYNRWELVNGKFIKTD